MANPGFAVSRKDLLKNLYSIILRFEVLLSRAIITFLNFFSFEK